MAKDIEIGVKVNGLTQIKQELKALKGELVNATDPQDIQRLSRAAGELADKISDANERVKVFAGGSEFEKISNGLGLVGQQLSSLDFAGAAESAKQLTGTIKDMDPKTVAQGFKDFSKTIGELGNAFFQMGLKLLANPIFLIGAIIGAVVIAIVTLKDKVKILGDAFDFLMGPINILIQGLKDLTDWIGITSFADEEATNKYIANSKRKADASKQTTNDIVDDLTRQINETKAQGKNTEALELKRQTIISASAAKRLRELQSERDVIKKEYVNASNDRKKELNERLQEITDEKREQGKIYKDANSEYKVIQSTFDEEEKNNRKTKRTDKKDDYKKELEDYKDALKAQKDALQASQLEITTAIGDAQDKNAEASMTAEEVEIRGVNDKYFRLIELARQQGRTKEEIDALEIAQLNEVNDIKLGYQNQYYADNKAIEDKAVQDKKDNAEAEEKIEKDKQAARQQWLQAGSATLKQAASLLGESTAEGKALAIAATTIDTYQSATAAYKSLSGIPVVGPALGAVAAGVAVAAGLANVKKIMSVKVPGGKDKGGTMPSGGPTGGQSAAVTPNFALMGSSNVGSAAQSTQSVEANRGQNITVKAVVSETEITGVQNRVSRIEKSAEL